MALACTDGTEPEACRCECGYTCRGPGYCSLEMMACIEQHWRKDCDHLFGSQLVDVGEGAQSVLCLKCGMSAMAHDCMVGP